MKNLGLYESASQVSKLMSEVDANKNGVIEFTEFLDIIYNIKQGKTSGFAAVYTKQKDLIQVKGHTGVVSQHTTMQPTHKPQKREPITPKQHTHIAHILCSNSYGSLSSLPL